jgi:epoxyqueuosine reductase QueG
VSKEELDRLEDQSVESAINAILDIEETDGIKKANKFESIEEIEKYLKQAENLWRSKQLSRVTTEHDYLKSDVSAVVVKSNYPSSEIYNLRVRAGNAYNHDCSCCNSR